MYCLLALLYSNCHVNMTFNFALVLNLVEPYLLLSHKEKCSSSSKLFINDACMWIPFLPCSLLVIFL